MAAFVIAMPYVLLLLDAVGHFRPRFAGRFSPYSPSSDDFIGFDVVAEQDIFLDGGERDAIECR